MPESVNRDQGSAKDPTRLCPVCRMPISILAVRCRFCGAEVGRPRKEQETFTVKDLGGEYKSTYTLSDNVAEALDAFISEERAQLQAQERRQQAAASKSFFRWQLKSEPQSEEKHEHGTGLPELDAENRILSSDTLPTRSQRMNSPQATAFDLIGRRTLVVAGIVAGLILLYFGTDFAWARIRNIISPQSAQEDFVYPNRAAEFYAAGTPLTEVLEEALIALRHNATDENREIAETMRQRLIKHVEDNAFSKPFDMEKLNQASADITRAAAFDSNGRITQLLEEINREAACFKFILTSIDIEDESASFRLNNPFTTERAQVVAVGDLLQDRFLVKRITPREVILEDISARGAGRQILARPLQPVEALL